MQTFIVLVLFINIYLVGGKLVKVFDLYGNGVSKSGEESFDFVQLENDAG